MSEYDPKDIAKIILNKDYVIIPRIDIDDIEQVKERATLYLNSCLYCNIIPTLSGLAYALGVNRRTLYNWKSGRRNNKEYQILIERYKTILEVVLTQMLLDNKVNASVGIFLLKNNFGYSSNPEKE